MEIAVQEVMMVVRLEPILDRSVNQRTTADALPTAIVEDHEFVSHIVFPLMVLSADVVRRGDHL